MSQLRFALLLAGTLTTVAALAGCSATPESMPGMDHGASSAPMASAPAASAAFSAQDVSFAQAMIPHHEQAVAMADLLLKKTDINPRVLALATEIRSAQAPEITSMTSWLAAWGAKDTGMGGMDHGSGSGMMSDAGMSALAGASGTTAERLFLEGMTAHHEGAIAMAQIESKKGKDPAAVALAETIMSSQTAEIQAMKGLLASR